MGGGSSGGLSAGGSCFEVWSSAGETVSKTEKRASTLLTAAVTREGGGYTARCLEVDVRSQGSSIEESLANLREALVARLKDAPGEPPRAKPILAHVEVPLG